MSQSALPIFSGGTGRSGATVAGKLLAKHPDRRGGRPYEIRFINDRFGLLELCYGVESFERSWKKTAFLLNIKLISPRNRTLFMYRFESRMRGNWWEQKNRIGVQSGLFRSLSAEDREEILSIFRKQFPRDQIQASRNSSSTISSDRSTIRARPYGSTPHH